ncbi:MAG TPA: sugar ABC transporter ATP-binding protein, partial [Spirochaetia bacterium]|nr:sugar ABC transporter ATP-binding protein [Spirochaetia bacterium]
MLDVRSVSKSFPGVLALDDVSASFMPGTIHALLGENGAGKSTLMKILCGIYQPDVGQMFLDEERLVLKDSLDAIRQKISIVHQEIQVVPLSTVAENIMLDKLNRFRRGFRIDWKRVNAESQKYMQMVDLQLSPKTVVRELSAAQKQLAQIARALSSGARVLLLDEPTSSLTLHEADRLFELLRRLRDNGVCIVFVSHKLEEVMALCDVLTVLRDGKVIGTRPVAEVTRQDIISMMIGRKTNDEFRSFLNVKTDEPVLEVRNLKSDRFDGISLTLHRGEILGLYGLVGSGRTELAKTIIGEYSHDSGEILVEGKVARIGSVAEALHRYRIGYVSENRKEEGLILSASVNTNLTITIWRRLARGIIRFLAPKSELMRSNDIIDRLEIHTPGPQQIINNLSGGNQQKVSIGKWLIANCDVLIIDEPTVGVDVGAKEYIHDLIWNMAKEEGKSIILISSDMPEIIALARRILVFKEFRIVGELDDLNSREYSYDETSARIGPHSA